MQTDVAMKTFAFARRGCSFDEYKWASVVEFLFSSFDVCEDFFLTRVRNKKKLNSHNRDY